MSKPLEFPHYTTAERAADAVVHIIGVPLGLAAAIAFMQRVAGHGFVLTLVSLVYAFGLVAMLGSSAAYQLCPGGALKERLRRLDRAMIFVMIAGTYTPISATVLAGRFGVSLCVLLWSLAAAGIYLTLRFPRRFERAILALYLAMGWMMLLLIGNCWRLLPGWFWALIIAGGISYTVGAAIQSTRLKYHNPVWHALVLLAASLQYAAISLQLTGGLF